ncbi:hypothetical protein BHU11_07600 [Tannerella sp. oral taxon 808]|nr:hypothetical protein BHU11_07600 [Tannerella sp. oral taxon 808]
MGVLNYNGALYMATGIDNSGLRRDASEAESIIEGLGQAAKKVGAMMGVAFTLDAAKDFAVKVATVRGEYQKLEVAFKTMLGSKAQADRLMQQLTQTAATTPFDLQSIAGGAKQLLAYGVAAGEVNDTLIRLGNIASGLSIPLNDLVYLYGTTMTQGRLFSYDLRQFTGRGIPLTEELAKQFGVTKDKVQELVTAGKVGFPEVQKAIESLTNEGGKFYNLMEEQSKTIAGKISNLGDAIDNMFNGIGKSQEGVIGKALDGVTALIENYQRIGNILGYLITAYGTYKAALIAVTAAKKTINTYNKAIAEQMIVEQKLAAAQGLKLTEMEARQAAQTKILAAAKSKLGSKLKDVAAALKPNMYAAAAAAVVVLAKAIYDMATAETAAEKAQKSLDRAAAEAEAGVEKERKNIEMLIETIKSENATKAEKLRAQNDLLAISPSIYTALMNEKAGTEALTQAVNDYIKARDRQMRIESIKREREEAIDRKRAYTNGTAELNLYEKAWAGIKSVAPHLSMYPTETTRKAKPVKEAYNDERKKFFKKHAGEEEETIKRLDEEWKAVMEEGDKAARKAGSNAEANLTKLQDINAEIARAKANLAKLRSNTAGADLEAIKQQQQLIKELEEKKELITGKSATASAAAYKKHLKELKKEQKDIAAAMEEIEELTRKARKRVEDADLEMMDEGLQKKLAKLDLSYQRELEEIEEWKKRLEKANEKATGKKDLTQDQTLAYYESIGRERVKHERERANATREWERREAEAYDEMLQAFGNYKEKEAAIAREYARRIADAEAEGRTKEAEKLRKEQTRQIAEAADEELSNDKTWNAFFKHVERQTLKTAKKVRTEIATTLKYLKTKGAEGIVDKNQKPLLDALIGDPQKLQEAIEKMENTLEKADDAIEGIQHQKVFDALIANFKKLRKSAAGSQEQMSALNAVINGLGSVGSLVSQLGNAMTDCDIKAGKVVSTIGNAITNAASFAAAGASVGGVWGGVVGAVVGAASAIIPAIGKVEEWTDAMEKSYQAQAKWLEKVRDANLDLIKGYGSVEEKVKATTEALQNNSRLLDLIHEKQEAQHKKRSGKGGHSIGYTNRQNLLSIMRRDKYFDNYEDWWRSNPEANGKLDMRKRYDYKKYVDRGNVDPSRGWDLLQREMKRGYKPTIQVEFESKGIDLYKFMQDPGGYLTENDPKKGALDIDQMKWILNRFPDLLSELDSTTVENINARMQVLDKEAEKIKEAFNESMTGVSFDGLLSEFEGFLKKADDDVSAIGKSIEGHLRDAIIKGLIDKNTQEKIRKTYLRISKLMENRKNMDPAEFQKQLQEAKDDLAQTYKDLAEAKRAAFEAAGIKDYDAGDSAKENTLRGALAKASQESIDLLAGQMGALRVAVEQILKVISATQGGTNAAATYYTAVRDSFTALREIQTAGWKEVSVIREVTQQMRLNQAVITEISETVAAHTAAIRETNKRMADGIAAIHTGGVKIKGGGLGL